MRDVLDQKTMIGWRPKRRSFEPKLRPEYLPMVFDEVFDFYECQP